MHLSVPRHAHKLIQVLRQTVLDSKWSSKPSRPRGKLRLEKYRMLYIYNSKVSARHLQTGLQIRILSPGQFKAILLVAALQEPAGACRRSLLEILTMTFRLIYQSAPVIGCSGRLELWLRSRETAGNTWEEF